MSEALSVSPPDHESAEAAAASDGAHAHAAERRIQSRRQIALGSGLEFAFARENIGAPTQWSVQHPRHTLIVHLDGRMRRLDTRIDGVGRLRAAPAPGDLWLIPAGRRYEASALGGDIAYAELDIDPARLAEYGAAPVSGAALSARMKQRDPFVHAVAARLAPLSRADDDLAAMLRESLGQALCLHLLREYAHTAPPPPRAHGARLSAVQRRRIEDYIQTHLDQRIRLDALARVSGLSPHRLLIAFRAGFGVTPIQYVLDERLRRACLRLRGGSDDIARIALETGFASHSHLSAVFKKRHGVTPRQYRDGG